jgi:hypothetical protein
MKSLFGAAEANNEAETQEGSSKPAPSNRLFVGGSPGPMPVDKMAEKGIAAEAAPTTKREPSSKPAPSDRLFVGGAFRPTTKRRRSNRHRNPRHRRGIFAGGCSRPMLFRELRAKASRLKPLLQRSHNAGSVIETRAFGPAFCERVFTPDALLARIREKASRLKPLLQ